MGLIKDLLKKSEEQQQIDALKYMYNRLKIGKRRNLSMQEYFDRHYRANCYYYSTFILMCMKPTDRLVRGCIHIDGELDFIYKSIQKGTCPNYEHCESSSQMIDYVVELDPNGNIASISYDIVNKDINYSIKYTFFGYGSNNVKVDFPANLESYIEK